MARILIVDDDSSYLELASTFLMMKNHEAIVAGNASEALDKLDQNPDLVLLDISMPGKNGTEVFKQIKEIDPDMKVAFLTQVDRKDIEENIEAEDYIEKRKVRSKEEFLKRVEKNL